MNSDRAVDFAARTEQITERQVRLNGTGILFQHIKEQVDGFILLVAEQEVNPRHVISRQAARIVLFGLLCTSAPHVPAVSGSNG